MPGKKVPGKIYHTKNGQPYKIMPNGRARFIKKSGAKSASSGEPPKKRRRKRTGGAARTGGSAMVGGGIKHYLHY